MQKFTLNCERKMIVTEIKFEMFEKFNEQFVADSGVEGGVNGSQPTPW